jgi:DNA-binding HxlR family transcriptional regulator
MDKLWIRVSDIVPRSSIGDWALQSVFGRLTRVTGHSHRPPRSGCAINAAIEVLGDPWSMLVLRDVIFGNRRHFRELLQGSEEGIASNILSSRLKRLVAAGLLTREEATRGQRAAYSLTEAGIQTCRSWSRWATGASPTATAPASCGCVPSCSATAVQS